jgi:hypothetical protein
LREAVVYGFGVGGAAGRIQIDELCDAGFLNCFKDAVEV